MTREAYSHEVIAFGFWPGDNKTAFPAFYSYTAPAPAGLTAQPLSSEPAWWQEEAGSAYLRYSDVRGSNDPEQDLLDFFESAYRAGAVTAGWDVEAFETKGVNRT